MKCLCKNGQNGDPSWKKSCSWSFNDAPWSASDLKLVQCKSKTQPTTQSTTSSTTPPTIQSTNQSTTVANPNTHRFCEVFDSWTSECSQCYSYTHVDNFFTDGYDDYSYEDFTCEFTISTICDPNFVDKNGRNCDSYTKWDWCSNRLQTRKYLSWGVMTDKGFMTGFNCPQCGCGENGPKHFHDAHQLLDWY